MHLSYSIHLLFEKMKKFFKYFKYKHYNFKHLKFNSNKSFLPL